MAQFTVSLWAYSDIGLSTFPQGSPAKKGNLSDAPFIFEWPSERLSGRNNWNNKPKVHVYVFQYDGNFNIGNSGGPVCFTGNNKVIGVFTAKDENYGFVIPIQTILEKFETNTKISLPSPSRDTNEILRKGNDHLIRKNYYEGLKQYELILKDPNYIKALNNKGRSLHQLKKYGDYRVL